MTDPVSQQRVIRLTALRDYLTANVYPHVTAMAMLGADGYLNDHGRNHVEMVVDRASRLLGDPSKLTAAEIFLLLGAIYLHDVGNTAGREHHEEKLGSFMPVFGPLLSDNQVELRLIGQIARAHGGWVDGDKDTISALPETAALYGEDIHPQMLAALLRFSDELADDTSRAARFLMQQGQIPATSLKYHAYSDSLGSVNIKPDERAVELTYHLTEEQARDPLPSLPQPVFLFDEILQRVQKIFAERTYCMRFLHPNVRIESIRVTINVWPRDMVATPTKIVRFTLRESGYPSNLEAVPRDLAAQGITNGQDFAAFCGLGHAAPIANGGNDEP